MERMIYKILSPEADTQMRADKTLAPIGVDGEDGFIHFSTAAQLPETLDKHYAGHGALIILAVEAAPLGAALRWEVSRGGDLFPHLYAPFETAHVAARFALNAARDGLHDFLQEEAL
jgi:uncharacterized protein (DUF952 family)